MAWRLPLMSNFLSLVNYVIAQPITLWLSGKSRPIGQFAGYDMAISPINTGDVAISNL